VLDGDPTICGDVGPRIGGQAPRCMLATGHDGRHQPHESWLHTIKDWGDIVPVRTPEAATSVVRTDVRGQCERGHVVKGEAFGPALPDSWMCSCPFPDCEFPIAWECRPDWLPRLTSTATPALGRGTRVIVIGPVKGVPVNHEIAGLGTVGTVIDDSSENKLRVEFPTPSGVPMKLWIQPSSLAPA
jgi:hypothetical protein